MSPPTAPEHYTQPAECYYARNNVPSVPGAKFATLVPLYQEAHPNLNMQDELEECCDTNVWLFEDPEPCTAVCAARSDAQAQTVQYCLNARDVDYGDGRIPSGAVGTRVSGGALWLSFLFCGLVLSGVAW
ncbi:hypothetical protein N7532_001768 [Penicillium argentinense]|uniref:Uncharacterized protein n=1 Tax=Penicillium argentinense TaxID=1131581 RepID=A0A9W9G395_9EURO|nr:uncharacterized protein N7532_001768 [Penicillium argentinense]KAJ5111233.1 hypothetical protein N7532_001768 [Penicillium argentinense]